MNLHKIFLISIAVLIVGVAIYWFMGSSVISSMYSGQWSVLSPVFVAPLIVSLAILLIIFNEFSKNKGKQFKLNKSFYLILLIVVLVFWFLLKRPFVY